MARSMRHSTPGSGPAPATLPTHISTISACGIYERVRALWRCTSFLQATTMSVSVVRVHRYKLTLISMHVHAISGAITCVWYPMPCILGCSRSMCTVTQTSVCLCCTDHGSGGLCPRPGGSQRRRKTGTAAPPCQLLRAKTASAPPRQSTAPSAQSCPPTSPRCDANRRPACQADHKQLA